MWKQYSMVIKTSRRLGLGSSDSVPAYQVQSPEFKPKYCQNKQTKRTKCKHKKINQVPHMKKN
jgi:hypothetical protein